MCSERWRQVNYNMSIKNLISRVHVVRGSVNRFDFSMSVAMLSRIGAPSFGSLNHGPSADLKPGLNAAFCRSSALFAYTYAMKVLR